jgi:hypothetical protein
LMLVQMHSLNEIKRRVWKAINNRNNVNREILKSMSNLSACLVTRSMPLHDLLTELVSRYTKRYQCVVEYARLNSCLEGRIMKTHSTDITLCKILCFHSDWKQWRLAGQSAVWQWNCLRLDRQGWCDEWPTKPTNQKS